VTPALWVVGYPRSGTTYLRALLANYILGNDRPLSLTELANSSRGEHWEELWTELTGKTASEREPNAQWQCRPAYFQRLRAHLTRTRIIKAHTPNNTWFGTPAFNFEPDDRIVHIVRHPCAVAVSSAAFYGISQAEAVERLFMEDLTLHGAPAYGFEFLGSWRSHTLGWMQTSSVPAIHIRYHDLVANTAPMLTKIVEFLGMPVDQQRISFAVAASSFMLLKALEQANGFIEAPKGRTFFREGDPFAWQTSLERPLQDRLLTEFADLITSLGFPRAPPVAA
jgi:hypothetical protein